VNQLYTLVFWYNVLISNWIVRGLKLPYPIIILGFVLATHQTHIGLHDVGIKCQTIYVKQSTAEDAGTGASRMRVDPIFPQRSRRLVAPQRLGNDAPVCSRPCDRKKRCTMTYIIKHVRHTMCQTSVISWRRGPSGTAATASPLGWRVRRRTRRRLPAAGG
jgi:hypothetical protein